MAAATPVLPCPGTADIVLAECFGQAWLVRGEPYIDDLLANTLQPDVSIEIVTCDSKFAVDALWAANGGGEPSSMWLIHPAILRRAKGQTEQASVVFAAWSALLDDDAARLLDRVARTLAAAPAGTAIALVRHLSASEPGIAAQMADLRCGFIAARLQEQLAALGAAPPTILHETADAPGQEDHIALRIR